jgi:nicotinamide-nucleotide amidase
MPLPHEAPGALPDGAIDACVQRLAAALLAGGQWLTTAESCTGGLIAGACTELAGSSAWFDSGVVSYSNAAKQELLAVPEALLVAHGAVSEAVALAMAEGAQARVSKRLVAQGVWAVAVTGVAGPGGGSADKPVGTVWIAWAGPGLTGRAACFHFAGDRRAVRQQTVWQALNGVLSLVQGGDPADMAAHHRAAAP